MLKTRHEVPPGAEPHHTRSGRLAVLESRWALRILLSLLDEQMRFSDLQRALPGISAKVLAVRLRELEAAMLIMRRPLPPPSAGLVYGLSSAPNQMRPVLDRLTRWLEAESNDRELPAPG